MARADWAGEYRPDRNRPTGLSILEKKVLFLAYINKVVVAPLELAGAVLIA